jgi:diguanylate cyclase (GGDEF)-like protein
MITALVLAVWATFTWLRARALGLEAIRFAIPTRLGRAVSADLSATKRVLASIGESATTAIQLRAAPDETARQGDRRDRRVETLGARSIRGSQERPPRLVLRFAILSGLCLGLGAAAILVFTRHLNTVQAERAAAHQAQFIGEKILSQGLRPSDVSEPVSGKRLRRLDALVRRSVFVDGTVRVTLSRPDRLVTYSSDHTLIGRKLPVSARTQEALTGTVTSEVAAIPDPLNPQTELKVLRTYVPLSVGGRTPGVAGIYQDYAPIESAATKAFLPVAGILEFVLLALYVLLIPLLSRVSRRIRRQLDEIQYQAFHDDLTDLPNRLQFGKRIGEAIELSRRSTDRLAVLLADLDRFKEINDTLGHQAGDELLRELGSRLRGILRGEAFVARLGGDEFGIFLPDVSATEALAEAARIRETLERSFVVSGVPLSVEASVGISLYPEHGDDVDTLIQRADVAMYSAKDRRVGAAVYDPEFDTSNAAQLALMSELREALEDEQLRVDYQLKVDMRTGAPVGAEALVRWNHPTRGLVMPGEFVPLAERTGVSRTLSRYVLRHVVTQLREWKQAGLELRIAVNLTMFDLLDLTLPDEVASLLEREGVDPNQLELEITEGVIMADPVRVGEVVRGLKAIGVTLAIDDFGTGYSSLSYLKRLPIAVIKIDRSFVLGMSTDASDRAIVRSTIDLAHNLGLTVVAEGVETDEVWNHLREDQCDVAQGFLVARPCPAEDLAAAIAAWGESPLVARKRGARRSARPRPAARGTRSRAAA